MTEECLKVQMLGDVSFDNITKSDAQTLLARIKSVLPSDDLRIFNLECPILGGPDCEPIRKTGPNLHTNESIIDFINELGADVVSLANNHIGDYGEQGVIQTIEVLKKSNILYVGAGNNCDEAYASFRFVKNGIKVSFLAICENEFGVATAHKAGVAGYSNYRVANKIREEKKISEHVIVFFHGGNEFNPLPSPGMRERYRYLIDQGVSAVVGTHTHCPQGYECYNNGIIVYSLGNFYFPNVRYKNPYSTWYLGYIAQLQMTKRRIDVDIIPYRYSELHKQIVPLNSADVYKFRDHLAEINQVICDEKELYCFFKAWSKYRGKTYAARLLWSENADEKTLIRYNTEIQNLFRCEAHRELMQTYFETFFEEQDREYWLKLKRWSYIPISENEWEEELEMFYKDIEIINMPEIKSFAGEEQIYICGAGQAGVTIYKYLRNNSVKIIKFLENDISKEGSYICDTEIDTYDCIANTNFEDTKFVVAVLNAQAQETIIEQLIKQGVRTKQIIVCISK